LLPTLPQNLEELYCSHNQLTLLPTLPQNLTILHCSNNQLNWLPTLPQNIVSLHYCNNPIFKIVNDIENSLIRIKQIIQMLNNVCHLCYCLKFKNQFRNWLWEKVRKPNAEKLYNPIYLIENLKDDDDLDTFLNNWL
jgi:Leucine-rich repeat (LRR) protein